MPKRRRATEAEKAERLRALSQRMAHGGLPAPEAIRAIRHALDMTQVEFAKAYRLTRQQVIDLEAGRGNPRHETLLRIAEPFGFTVGFVWKNQDGER